MLHLFSILRRPTLSFIFIQTHSWIKRHLHLNPSYDLLNKIDEHLWFNPWWLNLGFPAKYENLSQKFPIFCIPLVEKMRNFAFVCFVKKLLLLFAKFIFAKNLQNFTNKFERYEFFFDENHFVECDKLYFLYLYAFRHKH